MHSSQAEVGPQTENKLTKNKKKLLVIIICNKCYERNKLGVDRKRIMEVTGGETRLLRQWTSIINVRSEKTCQTDGILFPFEFLL